MSNEVKEICSDYGSFELDQIVNRLKSTNDAKRKYEYILWIGKKLEDPKGNILTEDNKVKGCISEVYISAELKNGKLTWEGFSDALITKGLLALLINGLTGLTPEEVIKIDNKFISETGLNKSLTPSRANGFLNILLKMKSLASKFKSGV